MDSLRFPEHLTPSLEIPCSSLNQALSGGVVELGFALLAEGRLPSADCSLSKLPGGSDAPRDRRMGMKKNFHHTGWSFL
jgi:aspartate aminotransferase-like enzyme